MSGRKGSRGRIDDPEHILECKAAYLTIFDDVTENIRSKETLVTVLQQSGRNPIPRNLNKYWTRDTASLSFDEFVDICRTEPITSPDDLMKAFRTIDTNGDGYISLDELCKIMCQRGEKMTRQEVANLIDSVDDNKDGRLDYREFSNMVMSTTKECKKLSMKVMEKKERRKKREGKSGYGHSQSESGIARPSSASSSHSQTEYLYQSPDHMSSHRSPRSPRHDFMSPQLSARYDDSAGSSATSDSQHKKGDLSHTLSPKLPKSPKSPKKSKMADSSDEDISEDIYEAEESRRSARTTPRINLKESPRQGDKHSHVTSGPSKDTKKGKESEKAVSSARQEEKGKISERQEHKPAATKGETVKPEKQEPSHSQPKKGDDSEWLSNWKSSLKQDHKPDKTIHGPSKDTKDSKAMPSTPEKEKDRTAKGKEDTGGKNGKKDQPEQFVSSCLMDEIFKTSARSEKSIHFADEMETAKPKPEKQTVETPKKKDETPRKSTSIMDKIFGSGGKDKDKDKETPRKDKEKETPRKDATQETKGTDGKQTHTDSKGKEPTPAATPKKGEPSPQVTPRKDVPKTDLKEEIDTRLNKTKHENGMGSQSSFRSGEKDGIPVPSPRKSFPRSTEEDNPKPSPRVRNTKSSTAGKGKVPEPRNLRDWHHSTSKGCFFFEDDEIVTHMFKFRLMEESNVYLTVQPIKEMKSLHLASDEPVDTSLYLLDNRSRKVVAFAEQKDARGKYTLKCDPLPSGEYLIVPFTTGCRFKQSQADSSGRGEAKLVKKDRDGKISITSAFRKALEEIFELCDLDGNGTMSKDEFNWFNLRTSGEELADDEWKVVDEKTDLVNGEISKEGFIALNEMEAEDSEGDVEDLWITLTSMGFNKALLMDEACPYKLDVYAEQGHRAPSLRVIGIDTLEKTVENEVCQSVMEGGKMKKIRGMNDLFMFTYKTDSRATIVLDNRSRSNVTVNVDCGRSKNVVSNRDHLDYDVEVSPQSSAVAHHLLPKNEDSEWTVSCTENIK